ncbi:hypothetical protein K435DRAFT_973704 [Dendrothele bispora CBS 962.96]|uniref:GATA-type domain-containing protein n=1 Tax=Dendrothele bispora (strain CBS 962.96) TaxID=1314807 RepID=A0A4S8KQK6_DENBC|nr:hypothetical protein K435DRAFT_973704 [Dendrothele bispora CBS 962.96]
MPSILNLKFKGNKSFVAFSNLGDAEHLTKTWKVCTKVASYLEQGQRLENLSWRLWHLQNLMVDSDNAKSKREFKKLSKCMSDKLDKEKGRSIEELEAPDFRRNPSSDMIRQRAAEKERNREASQNAKPGTIKRMQFTFSIDQPAPVSAQLVKKPDLKPSPEFNKRPRVGARVNTGESKMDEESASAIIEDGNDKDPPLTQRGRKPQPSTSSSDSMSSPSSSSVTSSNNTSTSNTSVDSTCLRFPSLFSNDFGPSALLYPSPTLTNRMNYGEASVPHNNDRDGFSIPRPTIELPLDELLNTVDSPRPWSPSFFSISHSDSQNRAEEDDSSAADFSPSNPNNAFFLPNIPAYHQNDVVMQSVPIMDDSNNAEDHTMTFSDLPNSHTSPPAQPLALNPATFNTSFNPDTSDDSSASVDSDDEASSDAEGASTMSSIPNVSASNSQAVNNLSSHISTSVPSTSTPTPTPSAALSGGSGRGRYGKATGGRGVMASASRGGRGSTPRPHLTVRTGSTVSTRSGVVLGATPTSLNPAVLRGKDDEEGASTPSASSSSNSATGLAATGGRGSGGSVTAPVGRTGAGASAMGTGPGGQKAECSNCGATHTPLWRRGLNDELNCNACGLYCKLHKRPRPKTMRNTHGEGRAQAQPRPETVDVMAQCYNCHTTATPLWRKDDEGKTVCNACGLYYKLHGSARPISMKSDVIRKRSRHDARRSGGALAETPSASPGVSRRASPARDTSPTLAPDSSTSTTPPQLNYQYPENVDFSTTQSELMGALGQEIMNHANSNDSNKNTNGFYQNMFGFQFPGPYHPDHLSQYVSAQDPLPFADFDALDSSMSPRSNKRRRMSTDSASEPPSSAVSYSSFTDGGYSSATSATSHSQRSSLDFALTNGFPAATPTSSYTPFAPASLSAGGMHVFRGSTNTFWHPPMTLMGGHDNSSSNSYHPPMLPPPEDSPMDYLHPPLLPHDDEALFSAYLHPPMSLPEDGGQQGQQGKQGQMESPKQQQGQQGTQGQQQQGQNQQSGQDYMVY